ncbi:MAG: hypothetical protein JXB05_21745 [Myxococcaceae bacterium]|nr:hypothetical protein [Myxococcaceae bacterium]
MLYSTLARGLGYWNRRVLASRHGREFLITIACEGGLPRALLTQEGNRLRRYFEQFLADRECFSDTPAEELAQRLAGELPRSLRQEVVFGLSADLINAVSRLRTLLGDPARVADPLQELNAIQPGWDKQIPLRLDDALARDLLRGLMRQPRPPVTLQGQRVFLETRLLVEGSPRLARRPIVPPNLNVAILASQLRIQPDELPVRFALSLLWSDGTRQPIGSVTRLGDKELFRTSGQPGASPDSAAVLTGPVQLVAGMGTRELGMAPLEGADMPPELPWVFTRPEATGPYVLRGCGPVRTRAEEALVVLPPGATWTAEPPEGAVEVEGLKELGRRVLRVQGTFFVHEGGDQMAIRTRQETDEARSFVVQGERLWLGAWGDEVFRGCPRVYEFLDGGLRQDVKAEWRPWNAREKPWQPLGEGALGDIVLRVCQGGEVRFRKHVQCLPKQARCEIVPGAQPGEGKILFREARVVDVGVAHPGVERTRHLEGKSISVHLKAPQNPPRLVPLQLQLDQGSRLEVRAMFPAREACFVGRNGQPVRGLVALHRLASIRARVFDPSLHGKCHLEYQRKGRNWRFLAGIPQREDGAFELALDSVAEQLRVLLGASPDLDEKVSVQIVVNGQVQMQRIQVSHYDATLDKVSETLERVEVCLAATALESLNPEQRARLRLEARPIVGPKDPPKLLVGTPEDGWKFELKDCQPGPWLLTSWLGDLAVLRSLRVTVPGEPPSEQRLARAIYVHARHQRLKQLGEEVEEAAKDPGHPHWVQLSGFLSTLGSLPASTYEIVRCMAENPTAVVLAWLKDGLSGTLWAGLEQLPFMWALVPARTWVHVLRKELALRAEHEALLAKEGLPISVRADFLRRLWAEAPLRASWMPCLLDLFHLTLKDVPPGPQPTVHMAKTEVGRTVLHQALQQAAQDLLSTHADVRWPEMEPRQAEWEKLWREIPREYQLAPRMPYQASVLRAPQIAAASAARAISLSAELTLELRQLRAFDDQWFDTAYGMTLACLLGAALQKNPELFQ